MIVIVRGSDYEVAMLTEAYYVTDSPLETRLGVVPSTEYSVKYVLTVFEEIGSADFGRSADYST